MSKVEQIISKELLSKVLEVDVISRNIKSNIVYYNGIYDCGSINIHELAHKCKEWALKDYEIHSAIVDVNKAYCEVFSTRIEELEFEAPTEPEAIFKACEWLLENKKDKQKDVQ